MKQEFTETAWKDYISWQTEDKKTLKRINNLIDDVLRNGFEGIGKPEPLKENLSGSWSRRIDDYHRLVYQIEGDVVTIQRCRGHY